MAYLYFNKKAFKRLIKVWRMLYTCPSNVTDEWLMEHFIPEKFIEDIEDAVACLKAKNTERKEK